MRAGTTYKIMNVIWLLMACLLFGCGPKIFSFDAMPRTVTSKDSIHLSWTVRGEPKLDFFQKSIPNPPSDSMHLLEFILTVRKGGNQTAPRVRQVELVSTVSKDLLVLPVIDRHGDTLIASGLKDTVAWKGFEIVSVATDSPRTLIVSHEGKMVTLADPGVAVLGFQGIVYDGKWEIRALVTPMEKNNRALIPGTLEIKAVIQPKKQ